VVLNRARNVNDVVRFEALTTNFYFTTTYNYSVQEVTASSNNQTTYTIPGGYSTGTTQVFLNGISLNTADYTASNGTTVVLTTGTGILAGSILRTHSFNSFAVSGALPLSGGTINGGVNVTGPLKQNGSTVQAIASAMSIALGM
jgi:hypothetical protein